MTALLELLTFLLSILISNVGGYTNALFRFATVYYIVLAYVSSIVLLHH